MFVCPNALQVGLEGSSSSLGRLESAGPAAKESPTAVAPPLAPTCAPAALAATESPPSVSVMVVREDERRA